MQSLRQKEACYFLILMFMGCMSFRLGATAYQGISTTNPGAAIYYRGNQFAADGDSYTGFVSFGGGLVMPSSGSGNVTIGSTGRFDGLLNWNGYGGKIVLTDDLECNSNFRISGSVVIAGGGYTLKLTGSLTLDGSSQLVPENSGLIIDGQGNTLTISANQRLNLQSSVSVTLRNMTLVFAHQTPIFVNLGCVLTLDNVNVVMSTAASSYNFGFFPIFAGIDMGQICIENDVSFSGPGAAFSHESKHSMSISSGATLTFNQGTTFQYYAGFPDRFSMADQTSKLRLNGCTLLVPSTTANSVTTPGLRLTKGMVEFDNRVFIENGGQANKAKGLTFGDGVNTANNVAVNILSEACVIVDGVMYYNQA